MKNHSTGTLARVLLISIFTLGLTTGCLEKAADEASTDPATTVTLSGTYYTSCVAIPGMVIGGATHTRTMIVFGSGGVASDYQQTTFFASDSSCNTNAYAVNQGGAFTIGSATTSPANGYNITFTVDDANILLYTTTARDDFTSGCGSWGPYTAAPSVRPLYSNINCANATMIYSGTLYNTFVSSGNTLTMGTPAGDNVGVTNQGSVSATQSLTFTK